MSSRYYDNDNDLGILTRIAMVIAALFVMSSYFLVTFVHGEIPFIKGLDNTGRRLAYSLIWMFHACGVAAIMFAAAKQKPLLSFRLLGIKDKKQAWLIPLGSAMAFAGGVALNRVVILLVSIIPFPQKWVESHDAAVTGTMQGNAFVAIIAVCVMAPVIEELCFRGKGFYYIRRVFGGTAGTVVAVVATSALFAASHSGYIQMIYAFVIGVVFSLLSLRSGSVIPSIFAHIGFNAANLIFYAINPANDAAKATMINVASIAVLVIAAVALFIIGGILRYSKDTDGEQPDIYIK